MSFVWETCLIHIWVGWRPCARGLGTRNSSNLTQHFFLRSVRTKNSGYLSEKWRLSSNFFIYIELHTYILARSLISCKTYGHLFYSYIYHILGTSIIYLKKILRVKVEGSRLLECLNGPGNGIGEIRSNTWLRSTWLSDADISPQSHPNIVNLGQQLSVSQTCSVNNKKWGCC